MLYEKELELLRSSFEKCRLKTAIILTDGREPRQPEGELERILSGATPRGILSVAIEPKTLYKLRDDFELKYKFLLLTDGAVLIVGPYLAETVSEGTILEIGERNGISPKRQRYLKELYESIPVLDERCPLFVMLDAFLERLWDSPSFAIVDVDDSGASPSPINEALHEDSFDDILVNVRAMERRYSFENELIDAVALGQLHKEGQLFAAFSPASFEQRVNDPMRNAKNYGIIMNTLLRKAAERGGVHPLYIDRVSSEFALRIENMSNLEENAALMCEMFRTYCRLVRKHSMSSYSPLVQKTILLIDSDLSADLSLAALSGAQGISSGYLSTVFKRETGKTLSEYVRERRVRHAAHLLSTTNLQIQTVALHCGILDLQYFSKLFKRETGSTPREYREREKSSNLRRSEKNLR